MVLKSLQEEVMEKERIAVEITYLSEDSEVITLKTDDLAWSMNQYQRNRLPLTWELIDIKEVVLPYDDDEPTLSWVRQTTLL